MAYTYNPFTGTFDNSPSTLNGDSAYSTLCAISADLVTTNATTTTPGISAVTKIIAVSAIPVPQQINTLYILI